MTISLCMIVKNEENTIERCLKCAKKFADEIIIADTGSADSTKEIAAKYTHKVYDFEWIDDFSAARNFSFSKASMDYIMWLDADDTVSDKDIEKLLELKKNLNPDIDAVLMKYSLGTDEYGRNTRCFYRERLIKRSRNFKWQGIIHEYIKADGNIVQADICINHTSESVHSDRNLRMLESIVKNNENVSSRELYYYAKELYNTGSHDKALEYYVKFFENDDKENIAVSDACIDMANCYMEQEEPKKALKILIRSMENSIMRPEILCCIGNLYKEMKEYEKAISWYELIFKILIPKFDLEIHSYELGGFIPCIDLCYCYAQLGNFKKAAEYNEQAAKYKPDDPIIEHNRQIFREAGII